MSATVINSKILVWWHKITRYFVVKSVGLQIFPKHSFGEWFLLYRFLMISIGCFSKFPLNWVFENIFSKFCAEWLARFYKVIAFLAAYRSDLFFPHISSLFFQWFLGINSTIFSAQFNLLFIIFYNFLNGKSLSVFFSSSSLSR